MVELLCLHPRKRNVFTPLTFISLLFGLFSYILHLFLTYLECSLTYYLFITSKPLLRISTQVINYRILCKNLFLISFLPNAQLIPTHSKTSFGLYTFGIHSFPGRKQHLLASRYKYNMMNSFSERG